jgi:hypothetical protein
MSSSSPAFLCDLLPFLCALVNWQESSENLPANLTERLFFSMTQPVAAGQVSP